MATIGDLSIGQNVLVAGQIVGLQPTGGSRYDTVKLALAKSVLKDEQKNIFCDPLNIDLASQELLARYEAAIDEETLTALEDGSASIMNTAVIDVSSAEILALKTTPKTLIAAPGAGKVTHIIGGLAQFKFLTAAYVTDGNTVIMFELDDSGDADLNIARLLSNASVDLLTAGEDQTAFLITPNNADSDWGKTYLPAKTTNSAVILKNVGSADPITGAGTLRLVLFYETITLA